MIQNASKSDILILAKEMSLEEIENIKILQDLARKSIKACEYISQRLTFKIGETHVNYNIHIKNSISDEDISHTVNINIDNCGNTTVTLTDGRIISFNFCSPQTIYSQLIPLIDVNHVNYNMAKILDEILDWAIKF